MTSGAGNPRDETVTLAQLVAALERIRKIHKRHTWHGHRIQRLMWTAASPPLGVYDQFCRTCQTEWPCPTIRALDADPAEFTVERRDG